MSIMSDLNKVVVESIKAENFAEEVTILAENKSGTNFSLYTVKNKNNVTFQKVPGGAGITGKGILGFVGGDKNRPTLISTGATTTNAISVVANPGWPTSDTTPSVVWDVKLEVTYSAGCTGEVTQTIEAL